MGYSLGYNPLILNIDPNFQRDIQVGPLYFGLSPLPVIVANEGLGWDPILKM